MVGSLIASLAVSGALILRERIPDLEQPEEVKIEDEPLRHYTYAANTRLQNFRDFGMSDSLATQTANKIAQIQDNREKYRKILNDQSILLGAAFCPSTNKLPQPYAALEFLVQNEGERRIVLDAYAFFQLERQPWYASTGSATPIYSVLHQGVERRKDATIMGVAAILSGREQLAIEGRGAWSTSYLNGGDFEQLVSELPGLKAKVSDYFALMHYLTELANEHDGICS